MKSFSKLLLVSLCFYFVIFPICAGDCSTPSGSIEALITSPQATPLGLPAVDFAGVQALLSSDETLETLQFPENGIITVVGRIVDHKSTAYAVPAKTGQELFIFIETPSYSAHFNVQDLRDPSRLPVHRGEVDGPIASISASFDTTYLIRPFLAPAKTDSESTVPYSITVSRDGSSYRGHEETVGAWHVLCEQQSCDAYQVGQVGGSVPMILRAVRQEGTSPQLLIEGGPFDASGKVEFSVDGREVGSEPTEPLLDESGKAMIIGPDNLSLSLAEQMAKGERLSITVSSAQGAESIEYDLDGFGQALGKISMTEF